MAQHIYRLREQIARDTAEIDQLKAERDAAVADADLHRNRCASILFSGAMDNVTAGEVHQWMRDYVDAKAERDALKAAAEKGTEYVLAQINQDLTAERDAAVNRANSAIKFVLNCAHDENQPEGFRAVALKWLEINAEANAAIDATRGEK